MDMTNKNKYTLSLALVLALSACGKGSAPALQTYHSADSLFSFQADEDMKVLGGHPNSMLLYSEDQESPYFKVLAINKDQNVDIEHFKTSADHRMDEAYAQQKSYITKKEDTDSLLHYQYSKGLFTSDEWFMLKKGEDSDFVIYYKGEKVDKKEALRLFQSLQENSRVEAPYLLNAEGQKKYRADSLMIDGSYSLMEDKTFMSLSKMSNTEDGLQHAYVAMLSKDPAAILNVTVFEINKEEELFRKEYLNSLVSNNVQHQMVDFLGQKAVDFLTIQLTGQKEMESIFVRGITFIYKSKLYQLSVTGQKEAIETELAKLKTHVSLL